jgi:trimeric autotransporter adhesin
VAGTGSAGFSGDGGPATAAQLGFPFGVAVDAEGSLYIADQSNSRIRKVSEGTITTVAGTGTGGFTGDGGPATAAQLSYPRGVAVDAAGNLYIADDANLRIRKVSGGTITTVAGNGSFGFSGDGGAATAAQLFYPMGVAVDAAGNLYVPPEPMAPEPEVGTVARRRRQVRGRRHRRVIYSESREVIEIGTRSRTF